VYNNFFTPALDMTDPEIKVPPRPSANKSAVKHQRRPSFHTRRRSQHSIASFGEIADDVIKAPALGSLGEGTKEDHDSDDEYHAGEVKPKKKHDRKSSNVHMLFGEDGNNPEDLFNEEESMDNIVYGEDVVKPVSAKPEKINLPNADMMAEQADLEVDGYSPRAIDLPDEPESPREVQKPSAKSRNQSFGGIVDLFGKDELKTGLTNPEEEVKRLREENRRLLNELEKSNRIKKQLEKEIDALRSSKTHSSKDELEQIKSSKIKLILAAVSEIDRMRSIILSQERRNSFGGY
jgi:hypothetical protein